MVLNRLMNGFQTGFRIETKTEIDDRKLTQRKFSVLTFYWGYYYTEHMIKFRLAPRVRQTFARR